MIPLLPHRIRVPCCIIRHRCDNGADLINLSPTIPAHKIDCDQAHFPFITVAVSQRHCTTRDCARIKRAWPDGPPVSERRRTKTRASSATCLSQTRDPHHRIQTKKVSRFHLFSPRITQRSPNRGLSYPRKSMALVQFQANRYPRKRLFLSDRAIAEFPICRIYCIIAIL